MRIRVLAALAATVLSSVACERADANIRVVDLSETVTLAVPEDASDLHGSAPARAASGVFAALTLAGRSLGIAIFDSTGAFKRELNAQGSGPGEFTNLHSVGFGPGDTLWAVEMTRAQAFAPWPDLRLVRIVTFGTMTSSVVTPAGFLSRGVFTTSGLVPPTLRDWKGEVVATFPPPPDVTSVDAQMGPVALRDATSVWFGHGMRYEISSIADGGTVPRRIRREVDWFPPDQPITGGLNVVRPPARLHQLHAGPDDRLWVMSRRAHPDWQPIANASPTPRGPVAARQPGSLARLNRLFEHVLEVFGPDGALVASRVLPEGMQGIMDGSTLYQVLEDDVGRVRLRLWHVSIRESP